MKTKHAIFCIGGFICFLVLIMDERTAVYGAQQGINLCIQSVIPALFPFFCISGFLTDTLVKSSPTFLAPIRKLCAVPKGAEGILITGFLGGYPVGARTIGDFYAEGTLHAQDAEHLLSFCCNAGPAFLFGMLSGLFEDPATLFQLWGIHITSAVFVSILHPAGPCRDVSTRHNKQIRNISDIVKSSISVMSIVCGWVILFRIVIAFLNRWICHSMPEVLCIILTGILELTNGCCELSSIVYPELRFVLCSGMLAFGGICVVMQTSSVISGLPLQHYLIGKILQTLFSLLLSASIVLDIGIPVFLFLILFVMLLRKNQKRSRNIISVGI